MATRRSRYSGAATQDRNEIGAVLVAAGLARHPSMGFPAEAERAAGIGYYWCRHRAAGPGARAARIIDRHRIVSERDDLPGTGKAAAQDAVGCWTYM
jgi:hypothetical protein